MSIKSLNEIREVFLEYFKKTGHEIVQSSSLVPKNDPTLLFTNAGMVQFKDFFTGEAEPSFLKASTAQKCVRAGGKHNDLENVGYTARHHTFFEMLGNFSFGAYFKEEAIYHAWQVVTKEFRINPQKLWITVFSEDEEAKQIWKKISGFSDEKIVGISTSDNFWSMGDTGPCGPCSEIFYDHGEQIFGGPPGSKDQDGDRFVEIWNLVFMQYEQLPDKRISLPKPCIDTGMGLERIATVLQGKHNNFETDLFINLIAEIEKITQKNEKNYQSYNVIADHIRSICFLIADGVFPKNEGRGYVLRRIMRRAIRHARVLGQKEPVLFQLVDKMAELMGLQYHELIQHKELIKSVILEEEKRFGATLDFGLKLVEETVAGLSGKILPGDVAFKLYDTYGFPVDLTADILRSRGISVDFEGFEQAMGQQRERSQKAGTLGIETEARNILFEKELEKIEPTIKKCYDVFSIEEKLEEIVLIWKTKEEEKYLVVLKETPFFAESGGQIGDTGHIKYEDFECQVLNTYAINSRVIHECLVTKGSPCVGSKVKANVDILRRKRISAHHSATHVLQSVLRGILGDHVMQRGSLVNEEKLRFDFTHNKSLTDEEKLKIENLVNIIVLEALPSRTIECSAKEAQKMEVLAFFEEKYGDMVRVVQIGQLHSEEYFSQELCGGTHVSNTGEIGLFKILSESGIAAGVRRIEAVCGNALLEFFNKEQKQQRDLIDSLLEENKHLQRQISQLKTSNACKNIESSYETLGNFCVEIHMIKDIESAAIQGISDDLQKKMKDEVMIVIGTSKERISLVIFVDANYTDRISAKYLIEQACKCLDGSGGGRANKAQGSGTNVGALSTAIQKIKNLISEVR
ncbi:MAG: alanine--tRNA ligase [Holosporales bacterium]|jgi:alanyl-tRNA synthetase|nr:alanine--tRNA ligase [Holosporales bacterium]